MQRFKRFLFERFAADFKSHGNERASMRLHCFCADSHHRFNYNAPGALRHPARLRAEAAAKQDEAFDLMRNFDPAYSAIAIPTMLSQARELELTAWLCGCYLP